MKKILPIILSVLILTACGSKYIIDKPNMPEEYRENIEQQLNDAIEVYNNATGAYEKSDAAADVGMKYALLGNYRGAIPYYEEVLKGDPVHLVALMNLASMYEEVGGISKALEYQEILYENYSDIAEINRDYIRLLLADGQFDRAQEVVDALSVSEQAEGNEGFMQSLQESIDEARQ